MLRLLPFALLIALLLSLSPASRADDGIFPPAPAAKSFIDFDGRGFLVNGKRAFLVSGSLHYPRVPRALWRDRLLRIKRAGFNTVQTYAFWNYHEPQEGRWDFRGEKDLDAFLKLIHELGMYAVVRPGPYVCAEWDSGGYPVWLRFKPGIRVREDNPAFLAATDRWYEKVMPIITANQIQKGGAVIMVQLENEHPQGWGKEMPNGYFRHLREKALALGMEVPYFFSGLHHGSDPAGDRPWDSKGRSNPWYSTEFWPGWYDLYGPLSANRFEQFTRGTWKILAYGGNGYNFYMLHGGTDFDTWNDDEVASSYDYGSAIGQAGDLRPIYYEFKHAALFAHSFADILEDSENATEAYQNFALKTNTGGSEFHVTARSSPSGTIVFLDNHSQAACGARLKAAGGELLPRQGSMILAPGEILPVVMNYKLLPDVTLELAAAHILGITQQEDTTTLVVYGYPSDAAELRFLVSGGKPILSDAPRNIGLRIDPDNTKRILWTRAFVNAENNAPSQAIFSVGKRKVRILSLSGAQARNAWFIDSGGKNYIVCGPEYVGEVTTKNGVLSLQAERSIDGKKMRFPVVAFGSGDQPITFTAETALAPQPGSSLPPALSAWEMQRGDAEATPSYFPAGWKFSLTPLPMGADGDTSAYAWYRAVIRAPKAGKARLNFSDAGDWLTAFMNGERAGSSKIQQRFDHPLSRTLDVNLKAGENTLTVLTAHYGRQKLFNYLGPLNTIDAKGLAGPVHWSTEIGGSAEIKTWRWHSAEAKDALLTSVPSHMDTTGEGWQTAEPKQDVFNKKRGFAWYRTTLPEVPGPHRRLQFESVDDNATVFLNGKRLKVHKLWSEPFDVSLDAAWKAGGPNELAVLVENTDGPGGITGTVTLESNSAADGTPVQGWRMRGGLGEAVQGKGVWKPFTARTGPGVPAFYRTEFTTTPPGVLGPHPVLRVVMQGMSRGFVWLNGHNLGRYPEKVPVSGLYLPECWLRAGRNTLLLFDEEGNAPTQVRLDIEEAASRNVVETSQKE